MKRRPPVNPLVRWVVRREELRINKECRGLPPPWTTDPILQKYRFTNVRRRDDRVSRWLQANVYTQSNWQAAGVDSFLMFTALCRWNNWPPALGAIMRQGFWPVRYPDWVAIGGVIDELKAARQKAWTGAYIITAKKIGSRPKGRFIVEAVVRDGMAPAASRLFAALALGTRRAVWEVLASLPSWGPFMAGQVVDDWGWAPWLLKDAPDTPTWAPQGPGSLRGFNRVLGLPIKTRHPEPEWCPQLQAWRVEIIRALGPAYEDMTLMDVQNCLCELDKYERVLYGEGKPRSNYKPETAY